jgi:tRNA threonylcarbamoyladenosine biosynthesis protein TsaE
VQRRRSESGEETEALAAELATELRPGDVVLISGELGAGKTTFVRGACRALGVGERVTSPTFTIGRLYEGRDGLAVAHLDLYRLDSLASEEPGFLEEYLHEGSIGFVEWPAVGEAEIGRPAARVAIEHAGGDAREIVIERA